MFLECLECGRETPGWILDGRPEASVRNDSRLLERERRLPALRPDREPTHYALATAERNGRLVRTLCGIWIEADAHRTQASCDRCQHELAQLESLEIG
jgi:hypothetical protein